MKPMTLNEALKAAGLPQKDEAEINEAKLAVETGFDFSGLNKKLGTELKFRKDGEGFRLMNSSLGADERSDEGASRKSEIATALKKAGYAVDHQSNIFKFSKK